MKYKNITKNNLLQAISIAKIVFPYESINGVCWPEESYRDYCLHKKDTINRYYLCFDGTECVGITGYYIYDGRLWLAWFGVLPEYRGKSYGATILHDTCAMVTHIGAEALYLYSNDRKEERCAQSMYKNHGFVLYRKGKIGVDPILYYRKKLI
jgi:GNAT superfamily N-acetyltransferase